MQVEALEARASGAAIFVYPDATEASGRSFDLETPRANNADMQLFVDMLAALRSLYCVDPTRVFATGLSRGAYFANFLNCRFGTEYVAGSCCRYCTIILTSGGPLCDGLRRGELH